MPKPAPSVDEALDRLQSENPAEADFKILLSAAGPKTDSKQKTIAATYIPCYFERFSKQQKAALDAMSQLTKCDDEGVRNVAVLNLKKYLSKFIEYDKKQVSDILINCLGDENDQIASIASESIQRDLIKDDDFKSAIFSDLPNYQPKSQSNLIKLITANIPFNEENVDQLLSVLKVAFKASVVDGLFLYRKNRKYINDEQFQPLVDELFQRLENSLKDEKKIKDVSEELLVPLFKFTKTLGNDSTTRLLRIIADYVIPHFNDLETSKQIEVIRKIANVSSYADTDKLLTEIYNNIYLNFPTENKGPINFSIIEATLYAFINLARKFNSTASKLIGTTLCYTGQPGEFDEGNDDEEKHAAFRKRVEYISSIAPDFVNNYDARIKSLKDQKPEGEEERNKQRDDIREAKIAKRCGNNVRHLTRLLLSNNPLSGNLPETPSWKKPKNDRRYGSNRRDQRNGRGRNSRFNRNDDRGNNRSRNGRFNNNNNRQRRGRFSNNNRR